MKTIFSSERLCISYLLQEYVVVIYVCHFYESWKIGEGKSEHTQDALLDSKSKTFIHVQA